MLSRRWMCTPVLLWRAHTLRVLLKLLVHRILGQRLLLRMVHAGHAAEHRLRLELIVEIAELSSSRADLQKACVGAEQRIILQS